MIYPSHLKLRTVEQFRATQHLVHDSDTSHAFRFRRFRRSSACFHTRFISTRHSCPETGVTHSALLRIERKSGRRDDIRKAAMRNEFTPSRSGPDSMGTA